MADFLVQWTQHNAMAIQTNKTRVNDLFQQESKITYIPRLCINGTEIDKSTHLKFFALFLVQTYCGIHMLHTGWLRIKYPTGQYAISPQPVV